MSWPTTAAELIAEQKRLAGRHPPPWHMPDAAAIAGVFVCFPQPGAGDGLAGDPAWCGAALQRAETITAEVVVEGRAAARYRPGLLALRAGSLLESAVRGLPDIPEVLLVNATGWDHPRRAGLALHLGAVLAIPTVGITHRPLVARGAEPADVVGAWESIWIGDERVGVWMRTRTGVRPLAVHAAWRTDVDTAVDVMRHALDRRARTPTVLRAARQIARTARASAEQHATRGGL